MTTRRFLLGALAAAPLLFGTGANAAEAVFTPAAFEAAQKAGKPILVHVTAPWCTVCAAQKPILAKLEAQPRFKDLQVFDVDFDSRKDVLKRFGVTTQTHPDHLQGREGDGALRRRHPAGVDRGRRREGFVGRPWPRRSASRSSPASSR